MIDISGMNKAEVLAKLYNASKQQGNGKIIPNSGDISVSDAQTVLDRGVTKFDYLGGRALKISLATDQLDPQLYDRDHGEGAAEAAINA
ncbi:MAG: hypothetical protein JKY54_17305 [Flavobacteriales bacterium]|nr:hypothetical protein [Flavobacteriales bacterium]